MRTIESPSTNSTALMTGAAPSQKLTRVAIADDHRLMLDGIKRALDRVSDITVVGEAMTGEDLMALVPRVHPDVVILDIRMPKGDGLATLQALRRLYPNLKVVMLSMSDDPEHIDAALRLGASSYLVKSINPLDLPTAIRGACHRTVYHPRAHTSGDTAVGAIQPGSHGLTSRELAVLKLVAEGPSNVDIARMLCVTEQTVKFHLSNIYHKLGVRNRTEATGYAYHHGLVD
jgi:DNA-binding NarL/FixJ family response regulator